MKKLIPVVMISDAAFVMPTSVAMTSVVRNKKKDVFIEFYVIMPVSNENDRAAMAEFTSKVRPLGRYGCHITTVEASIEKYSEIKQMAHIPQACLLKFDIANLVPDYDKVLYMDGDVIVRGDLWHMYSKDIENCYAAGVKDFADVYNGKSDINAGIMLLNTRRIREENLIPVLVETRKGLGDRNSMDQTTFNMIFGNNVKYLGIEYNCIPEKLDNAKKNKLSIERVNELYGSTYESYKEIYDSAIVVHYASGRKPWKYTYIKEAKEWYRYYRKSPYFDKDFKMYGWLGFRIHKYSQILREIFIKN